MTVDHLDGRAHDLGQLERADMGWRRAHPPPTGDKGTCRRERSVLPSSTISPLETLRRTWTSPARRSTSRRSRACHSSGRSPGGGGEQRERLVGGRELGGDGVQFDTGEGAHGARRRLGGCDRRPWPDCGPCAPSAPQRRAPGVAPGRSRDRREAEAAPARRRSRRPSARGRATARPRTRRWHSAGGRAVWRSSGA